jgi:hypothetical protein
MHFDTAIIGLLVLLVCNVLSGLNLIVLYKRVHALEQQLNHDALAIDAEHLPRCENLDGTSLTIVSAYTEAGDFMEANRVTIEDKDGRRAVYAPIR